MNNKVYSIVKRPIVSEKSTAQAELARCYSFEVDAKASKPEIRNAIQQLFKVKVQDVRTMMVHGKEKQVGRFRTKRTNWKKALVTLSEGQKIDFFQTK